MRDPLTTRQRRFVEEYLCDLSPANAYRRAGYKVSSAESARAAASRLLANVKVAAAVGAAMQARSERTHITQDQVLQELAVLAFSNISHYDMTEDGVVELTADAPPEAIRALANVRHKRIGKGDGYAVAFKLWDKVTALSLLGKHLGLWREKVEPSDPRDELYKALLSQLKSGDHK